MPKPKQTSPYAFDRIIPPLNHNSPPPTNIEDGIYTGIWIVYHLVFEHKDQVVRLPISIPNPSKSITDSKVTFEVKNNEVLIDSIKTVRFFHVQKRK